MITARQRSYLKSLANPMKPLVHIGKEGITEAVLEQIDEVLKAHELVKVAILETAVLNTKATAIEVCERIRAEYVQAIGNRFTIYKKNHDAPKIDLSQRGLQNKTGVISTKLLGANGIIALKKAEDKKSKSAAKSGFGKGKRSAAPTKGTRSSNRGK